MVQLQIQIPRERQQAQTKLNIHTKMKRFLQYQDYF